MKKVSGFLKKLWRFIAGPPLREIEQTEKNTDHFTKGICYHKLFWIFFIGCFAGVIVELLYCFFTSFHFESRNGVIYGPFNPVYGFGATAMTLFLYKLRHKSDFVLLVGGTVVGAVTEYACSWVQEMLFGSVSWDYSDLPFHINGRICLLYSMFWGVLAIVWFRLVYPRMCSLLMKIPNKVGRPLTWVLTVFMILNMFISSAAVMRWSERLKSIPPATSFDRFLDERYDNERLERIYPNMRFDVNGGATVTDVKTQE